VDERVEVIPDALIEAVELRSALAGELGVGSDRREKTGGQRGVDALEKLEEDETDRIADGEEPVAARVRQLFKSASPSKLRWVAVVSEHGI
jgi:hypothetical protein